MEKAAVDSTDREVLDRLRPVGPTLIPGITVVATPEYPPGHASLLLKSEGLRVAVVGDATSGSGGTNSLMWANERAVAWRTICTDKIRNLESWRAMRVLDIVEKPNG